MAALTGLLSQGSQGQHMSCRYPAEAPSRLLVRRHACRLRLTFYSGYLASQPEYSRIAYQAGSKQQALIMP